jgi:hypothetical protein
MKSKSVQFFWTTGRVMKGPIISNARLSTVSKFASPFMHVLQHAMHVRMHIHTIQTSVQVHFQMGCEQWERSHQGRSQEVSQ